MTLERKKIQTGKYLAAFVISTLVFIMGILVGNQFNGMKMDEIASIEQDIQSESLGAELQYLLISENPCEMLNSTIIAEELFELGNKLTYMESELGKTNERVIQLKEYYSLLEIKHLLFLRKAKQECSDVNQKLVLYFYSNQNDCSACENQGEVLTYLHEKYGSFNVYSFDVNIDNPALSTLKTKYAIKTTPSIVLDEELLEGFQSTNVLREKLQEKNEKEEKIPELP